MKNTTVIRKPYQPVAWFGTTVLLIAATLAAFNIYPWYVYGFCLANGLWVLVGILWREQSLIVLNAGLTVIYVAGLILA
jgi:integral membrane sensor domain MASE1